MFSKFAELSKQVEKREITQKFNKIHELTRKSAKLHKNIVKTTKLLNNEEKFAK